MGRTADSLVEFLYTGEGMTMGAAVDYGFGPVPGYHGFRTPDNELVEAYRKAVVEYGVTADDLHKIVGNGAALSELIGVTIVTNWDFIEGRL